MTPPSVPNLWNYPTEMFKSVFLPRKWAYKCNDDARDYGSLDLNIDLRSYLYGLQVPGQGQEGSQGHKGEPVADNVMTVAKDPRYARYLKMVQVVRPPSDACTVKHSCCVNNISNNTSS